MPLRSQDRSAQIEVLRQSYLLVQEDSPSDRVGR